MASKAVKKPEISFEQGLERLERIASEMEQSELPLEQLLQMYEEGMKLSSELTQKLEAAKGRMQEIRMGKNGEPTLAASDVAEQGSLLDVLKKEEG